METSRSTVANVCASDDKLQAMIALGDVTYHRDAPMLSKLLSNLMFARSELLPSVPIEAPPVIDGSIPTANWGTATADFKCDVILALPHPGLGWTGYRFSQPSMRQLVRDISVRLRRVL